MKRFLPALLALALFASCVKEQAVSSEGSEFEVITDLETDKTYLNGSNAIIWGKGEYLRLWYNDGSDNFATSASSSADSGEGKQKTSFKFTISPSQAASYKFGGVYPASCAETSGNTNPASYKVTLPSQQNASQGAYDPAAFILVAKPVSASSIPSSITVSLRKAVALNVLTLKGVKEKIKAVEITAEGKSLSGGRLLNLSTGASLGFNGSGSKIRVSFASALPSGDAQVFFTSWETLIPSGGKLTVLVEGETLVYTRTVTAGSNGISFREGMLNSLSMNFADVPCDVAETDDDAHPSLFINKAGLATYRSKLSTAGSGSYLRKFHDIVVKNADDAISGADPAPAYKFDASNLRILTTASIPAERQLLACAYAFKTTGQKKYLDKAVSLLKLVCGFTNWNAAKHSLDMAEMAVGVATAYDWLYNSLDATTRATVKSALYNFAMKPHLNAWNASGGYTSGYVSQNYLKSTNNWNQICCAGAAVAALALKSDYSAEAARIINQCINSVKTQTPSMYGSMGNYNEGPSYWAYGTGFQCILSAALTSVTGSDSGVSDIQGWDKTPVYQLWMDDLSVNKQFNYCDANPSMSIGLPMFFFAAKSSRTVFLYNEARKTSLYSSNKYETRTLPIFLLYTQALNWNSISTPSGSVYQGNGVQPIIVARTGWTGAAGERYLGLKGGTAYATHAQMDVGSFVYDAGGVRWSCDPGNAQYSSYESSAPVKAGAPSGSVQNSVRWWVNLYNNKHHSTLSVGDASLSPYFHNVGSNAARAGVTPITTAGNIGGSVDFAGSGNLSSWLSSAKRTVTIVNDDYCKCVDVLKASGATRYIQWRMCTQATPTVESGRIKLVQNGKTLYLSAGVSGASNLKYSIFPILHESYTYSGTTYANTWDVSNMNGYSMVGFTCQVASGATATLTTTLKLE
ncbi:MAG: heparinase II/III family protein [Bacteroidales bacterium]|nr:heparinase II/III family protein [Bacteroidales bacterium]